MLGCKSDQKEKDELVASHSGEEIKKNEIAGSEVIEIDTTSMEFQTKDEFPSGWNTFRYKNKSNEIHLFDKYPEGGT